MILKHGLVEKTAQWGSAGFGLLTALIALVNLVAEAKNGPVVKAEPVK